MAEVPRCATVEGRMVKKFSTEVVLPLFPIVQDIAAVAFHLLR